MKIAIVTILFIIMSAYAYGQGRPGTVGSSPRFPEAGVGHNPTTGHMTSGRLHFLSISGQDEMAPATRKKAKVGKFVTTNGVMSSDQCRVRDGGCIRPLFPPKKPKVPTRTGYFAAVQSDLTAMALQTGDQGAKKKKETKKETKPKTDKLNIPIFED